MTNVISPRSGGGVVVFSGGSAANNLVDVFRTLVEHKNCSLSYIIPISDNGGSSSELIRVFGGPGIGDVRSRLIRLIPEDQNPTSERAAIKAFFNHRLSPDAPTARVEWLSIVEALHPLWTYITPSKRELIRSFLNLLNLEIVKRARPSSVFNFQSASVGNMFLTGARLFCGSFESALYLLGSIGGVPENVEVIPAINSNFSHHISSGLADGTTIMGQNAISHPSAPTALPDLSSSSNSSGGGGVPGSPTTLRSRELEEQDRIEDANLPGSLPMLRKQYITFSKTAEEDLPSRIERIWYINPYGQEIRPPANPKVAEAIRGAQCIIYSIGSLYTSIVPSLILRGVGEALSSLAIKYKILILNGSLDRETGPSHLPFTAIDFVAAIALAATESKGLPGKPSPQDYKAYVTHLIHLEGEGAPKVNGVELRELGIETVRLYGRKLEEGKGLRYDGKALNQALEAILGRRDPRADKARRNTLEH
ncbi:MAG: hypothetical protein M1827_006344 [Pycnora praestabilis]|nr:MAG: hypothetical protein M1827_006344 [Pycnora praestabilis]